MTCSVCGEKIEEGAKYFEYFEAKESGGNKQVIMCVDCLEENLCTLQEVGE